MPAKSLIAASALLVLVSSACGSNLSKRELTTANADAFKGKRIGSSGEQGGAGADTSGQDALSRSSETVGSGVASADVVTGGGGASGAPAGSRRSASGTTAVPGVGGGAQPAGTKGEIRLGSLGVETGPLGAAMLPMIQGARAWAADVNSRGGVAGHPVRVIFADDGGEPGRAQAIVRRFVEQDHVQALFGTHVPTTERAIIPLLEEKQLPAIGNCGCSDAFGESDMIFSVGGIGGTTGLVWAHLLPVLTQSNARKAAVLYCREAATCTGLDAGVRKAAPKAGLTIVYRAQMSIAQPDYTAEMIGARNAGADVVIGLADNATIVRMARSAHRQGYFPTIGAQHGTHDEKFVKDGGKDVEGVLVASSTAPWSDSPLMADYNAAIRRFVPGGVRSSGGAQNWAAGKLIERIAGGFSNNPTSKEFIEGLRALHGETLGGMIPPTTYKKGLGSDAVNQCIIPMKIVNGKFVAKTTEFVCVPGFKPPT